MHSLRTRITVMTVCVILASLMIVSVSSVFLIRKTEHRKTDQLLLLLCESGERNLDYYFTSVQKSVRNVASFAEADLDGTEDVRLARHVERVREYFDIMASRTNGVLTYYYRIDPAVSDTVKGFWYTDLDGEGFAEHEVTDITLYDTEDTSGLVWFTVPKFRGEAVWLPPYITDNLDVRVISYNVPIYWRGQFVGVVGIEVDYSTMAEQVDSIRLFSNGYAYVSDAEGKLFYHPRIDVTRLTEETMPEIPDGAVGESTFLEYTFEGVRKTSAWLPLSNGMRLNVTVPDSEAEGDWRVLIWTVVIIAAAVLAASGVFVMLYMRRITGPLEELTEAADRLDQGSYDLTLSYSGDDEVGRLTSTFQRLAGHMKTNITDLSKRAYVDALTSVRNKGAYSAYLEELQTRVDSAGRQTAFAIGVFDCDNLKLINDRFGHDKGDIYLKTASRLICLVFQHSPVFRIGGDEFAVVLQNEDYRNRDRLIHEFEIASEEKCAAAENEWEQVRVTLGIAVYDPAHDRAVNDVMRRADMAMYENKRERKKAGRTPLSISGG